MSPSNRTWSVFESTTCHYCGGLATTVDHVVPRALLPKPMSRVPYWFRSYNIVPSCLKDNGDKAWFRSDCTCEVCVWCWKVAVACFITVPDFDFENHPVVKVVRSPG